MNKNNPVEVFPACFPARSRGAFPGAFPRRVPAARFPGGRVLRSAVFPCVVYLKIKVR